MRLIKLSVLILHIFSSVFSSVAFSDTPSFEQAKQLLKKHVYFDQYNGQGGDFYCGCDWIWVGRSGGQIDMSSCGYQVRSQENRAKRIEYEHVLPARAIGQHRLCLQSGGRENCAANDPVFS